MPDESRSPTYRHKPRTIPFQPAAGDDAVIDAVTAHVERWVGPVDSVYHEIVSDLVHLDVHVVRPTPERDFYTLVTSGLSEAPMTTPEGAEAFRFAELMICLPPAWPLGLDRDAAAPDPLTDEAVYWPVRLLKATARMPHEYDTWIGYGHTLGSGDPPEPYAPGTALNSVILLPSASLPEGVGELRTGERVTHFYALYPLYAEELAYKLKHGSDALIDKFVKAGVTDVLDPQRPNACRRKWLGLF